ncbi:MAG: hypothetical protein RL291_2018 [Pseudomonadota bacterium]|jgi:hypothetical protein
MRQGWIQIAGLIADITGFLLIVTEWWNAVIRERAIEMFHTAQHYDQVARQLKEMPRSGRWFDRLLDYLMVRLLEERGRALARAEKLAKHDPVLVFRKRMRNFMLGASLVILGFFLQVLSAVPGGIPFLGIIP